MSYKIFPSILSADFANLANEVTECESAGATGIHIDIMDGQFVPPITFGPMIVKSIKPVTNLILDIHLMVIDPNRYFHELRDFGADSISFHVESSNSIKADLDLLSDLGVKRSLAINPDTPINQIVPFLSQVDQVLIMSVNPGYGGQQFISSSIDKIADLKNLINEKKFSVEIQVDGGINAGNAGQVILAGADSVVAGSAVFNTYGSISNNINKIISNIKREV